MLSSTLREYKDSYKANLSAYLMEYEDNTEASFLSSELEKYTNYYNSLVKNDSIKLNNTIVSLDSILEFISKKYTISRSSNKNATALYLTGKLPPTLNEQQSAVPGTGKIHTQLKNPYPRIFTSYKAFLIFDKLKAEFGIKKKIDLVNYSFVYHKMLRDDFVFDEMKHKEFIYFLLEFDISIDKIKPWNEIGNLELKERIYKKVKEKHKTVS